MVIPEHSTELTAFVNGELDIMENIPFRSCPGSPRWRDTWPSAYRLLLLHGELPPEALRRRAGPQGPRPGHRPQGIVEKVRQSSEIPACGLVPEGLKGQHGQDFSQTWDVSAWTRGKAKPEEAKKLLAEAGYPDGKGFPSSPFSTTPAKSTKALPRPCRKCGGRIWASTWSWGTRSGRSMPAHAGGQLRRRSGNWWGDYPDPMTFLEMFTTGAGTNWPRWSNPE